MLIELGNDTSVNIHEIDSIYTESPPSDADFAYHPVIKVATKSGTTLDVTKFESESELRDFIKALSPTSSAIEHEEQEPVDITTDTETEPKDKDDLGDLTKAVQKIGEELEAIRSIMYRLGNKLEDRFLS